MERLKRWIPNLLAATGLLTAGYGLYVIHPSAAYIGGGVCMVVVGVRQHQLNKDRNK